WPLLELLVDAREATQTLEVLRLDLDDLAVRLRGTLRILHLLVESADTQLGGRDVGGVGGRREPAGEDVDEVLVLPARGVDALEVLDGGDELRIDFERTLEVRDRLIRLVHLAVEQLAELRLDLFAIHIGHGDVERARERGAELLPVAV